MSGLILLVPILLPILGGAIMPLLPFKKRKWYDTYSFILVLLNAVIIWSFLITKPTDTLVLFEFASRLEIAFHIDGLSMVFAGILSSLWPLAMLYTYEYMEHSKRHRFFLTFYVMTFGVTVGIAFAANLLTMYFFYELLTLVTVPLVIHSMTNEAVWATRKYLYYSIGGAAFAFIGMVFSSAYSNELNFKMGGILDLSKVGTHTNALLIIFVIAFWGFGVKAALFPFSGWLPQASVAPTPVTALLHAVAVVKAGAFAVMRLTYYTFGIQNIKGTWAHYVVMVLPLITILYGSSMAVKERHLKRRLAYSTISNLSYILFGVAIMSPLGLAAALTHMVFHAIMKITSFFCAGAVMHKSKKNYIYELNGIGRKMPITFTCFTIASLALIGVPLLPGFLSKWYLIQAALDSTVPYTQIGVLVLTFSAFLTAVYMLSVVVRAFFIEETKGFSKNTKDPTWRMLLPLLLLCMAMFYFGLHSQPLTAFLWKVANGTI